MKRLERAQREKMNQIRTRNLKQCSCYKKKTTQKQMNIVRMRNRSNRMMRIKIM